VEENISVPGYLCLRDSEKQSVKEKEKKRCREGGGGETSVHSTDSQTSRRTSDLIEECNTTTPGQLYCLRERTAGTLSSRPACRHWAAVIRNIWAHLQGNTSPNGNQMDQPMAGFT
jgi:hypothetical protein